MSRRHLTEPEAWEEIAARIETKNWRFAGLCAEVHRLRHWAPGQVSLATQDHMLARIKRHLGRKTWAFPMGARRPRVTAALFLAAESESEG